MQKANPVIQVKGKASMFSKKKATPVSAKQAKMLANALGKKSPKAPVVDAEDKLDGGADEATEKE